MTIVADTKTPERGSTHFLHERLAKFQPEAIDFQVLVMWGSIPLRNATNGRARRRSHLDVPLFFRARMR
jgi:hypothetical protein